MTDDRMAPIELVETQAGGARTPMREVRRNGYRGPDRDTRAGRIAPEFPKLHAGRGFPSFPRARRNDEKALVAVIQAVHVHGISTRSVDGLVKAMGAAGLSKHRGKRLCAEIDERVFRTILARDTGPMPKPSGRSSRMRSAKMG